ncbi:4802_t:CDS:1, partial [Racocetra fulgida]
ADDIFILVSNKVLRPKELSKIVTEWLEIEDKEIKIAVNLVTS